MASPALDKTPNISALRLFDLTGRTALLTGGTRGIGASCALALAEAGADIVLAQRPSSSPSLTTHDAIVALGRRCTIISCDLGDLSDDGEGSVKKCFAKALEAVKEWGKDGIEILINCGGIQRRAPAVDFLEKDWDDVIDVNLKSIFLLCQQAGRHMIPRRYGKIVNFASLLTFQGGLTVPAYASAKSALGGLTKALSNEWSQHNISVNAIAPGYIATDMNERLLADPTRLRQISERIPAGRWGEPDDFKGVVVFLASKGVYMLVERWSLSMGDGWADKLCLPLSFACYFLEHIGLK